MTRFLQISVGLMCAMMFGCRPYLEGGDAITCECTSPSVPFCWSGDVCGDGNRAKAVCDYWCPLRCGDPDARSWCDGPRGIRPCAVVENGCRVDSASGRLSIKPVKADDMQLLVMDTTRSFVDITLPGKTPKRVGMHYGEGWLEWGTCPRGSQCRVRINHLIMFANDFRMDGRNYREIMFYNHGTWSGDRYPDLRFDLEVGRTKPVFRPCNGEVCGRSAHGSYLPPEMLVDGRISGTRNTAVGEAQAPPGFTYPVVKGYLNPTDEYLFVEGDFTTSKWSAHYYLYFTFGDEDPRPRSRPWAIADFVLDPISGDQVFDGLASFTPNGDPIVSLQWYGADGQPLHSGGSFVAPEGQHDFLTLEVRSASGAADTETICARADYSNCEPN